MSSATLELRHFLTTGPPNATSKDPTSLAYSALQHLRDIGDPSLLFIRTLIELPRNEEEILFHCITGFRHVMLHKWDSFDMEFKYLCRDYVLHLGLEVGLGLSKSVQMGCLNASASFWKRCWMDDSSTGERDGVRTDAMAAVMAQMNERNIPRVGSKMELFSRLEALLSTNAPNSSLAASFLSTLLGEFSSGSGYNQPLQFHSQVKQSFQSFGLTESLQLSISSLQSLMSHFTPSPQSLQLALSLTNLLETILSWEFTSSSSSSLIRPPSSWRPHLLNQPFLQTLISFYQSIQSLNDDTSPLSQSIRQLFQLYTSLTNIFSSTEEQIQYCSFWTQTILSLPITSSEEITDISSLILKCILNFKLSMLKHSPHFRELLQTMTKIGCELMQQSLQQCIQHNGDLEMMEDDEAWRKECLGMILESGVLLTEEAFFSHQEDEILPCLKQALSPLYNVYVPTKLQMANLEEQFLMTQQDDMNEVREEIASVELEEEMTSVTIIARLDFLHSIRLLQTVLQSKIHPLLQIRNMTPPTAGLLEETRLLIICITHLFTDESKSETPCIPQSIPKTDYIMNEMTPLISSLISLSEMQVHQLVQNPESDTVSPLLATTIVWFFERFVPAYIGDEGGIYPRSESERIVSLCATLSLQYVCYWPQERQHLNKVCDLLSSIVKRSSKLRHMIAKSISWKELVTLHCRTSTVGHDVIAKDVVDDSRILNLMKGYQRMNYEDRGKVLTCLLIGCSEEDCREMWNACLESVQSGFQALIQGLSNKQISPHDIQTEEHTLLCISLYNGIAKSSEIPNPQRIPQFITPSLPHLSNLMHIFGQNLSICESLLKFFRDYTESFILLLNREQSLCLFHSCAELLQQYSVLHCQMTRVRKSKAETNLEEEQSFSDVLTVIQLLVHLGTKDFDVDVTNESVDSKQVTDVIFFGIQQIIPLMTTTATTTTTTTTTCGGLLQYPMVSQQYFSLVGFMMDTYPEKACQLPQDLFHSLLESLLFGMSHYDASIGKNSLKGLGEVVKEHLKTNSLHPNVLEGCIQKLLTEVIFQKVIWDRMESAGMALLPLIAAVDVNGFVKVVGELIGTTTADGTHRERLEGALGKLVGMEDLRTVAVGSGGFVGRKKRLEFKKHFEGFVKDVHSLLVLQ